MALLVVSGISPGDSGTGRFVGFLEQELEQLKSIRHKIVYPNHKTSLKNALKSLQIDLIFKEFFKRIVYRLWLDAWIRIMYSDWKILLIHPQELGFHKTISLIQNSRNPVTLYLLDSSYFCIRSYNHIPGENTTCLECLNGNFEAVQEHSCIPYPKADKFASGYTSQLLDWVKNKKVVLLAQNNNQAALAEKHFKSGPVPVMGLWTDDLDKTFKDEMVQEQRKEIGYDVIFHGDCLDAKGVHWTLQLARLCTELKFLFPFQKSFLVENPPSNCDFKDIRWETGLKEEIKNGRLVLVPSLWSAPVESALIKSIVYSRSVGVVENLYSFSNEIPSSVILKLPAELEDAAGLVRSAVHEIWKPDLREKKEWLMKFKQFNENSIRRIIDEIYQKN